MDRQREGDWYQSYSPSLNKPKVSQVLILNHQDWNSGPLILQVTHNGEKLLQEVGWFLFYFNSELHVRALNVKARNFLFRSISLERQSFHQRNSYQVYCQLMFFVNPPTQLLLMQASAFLAGKKSANLYPGKAIPDCRRKLLMVSFTLKLVFPNYQGQ